MTRPSENGLERRRAKVGLFDRLRREGADADDLRAQRLLAEVDLDLAAASGSGMRQSPDPLHKPGDLFLPRV